MAFQDLEARRLTRYGPCRDLAQATELREETLLAIDAWYRKYRQEYANPTDPQTMAKGRKQWMAYCEQLCQERPEFRCADGISTSYSFISPETMSARAEKRELFWDWLAKSAKEGTNRVLNESRDKRYSPGHAKWCHTYQQRMSELQFAGGGDRHRFDAVLENEDTDRLNELRDKLDRQHGTKKKDVRERTKGKSSTTDDIRAFSLFTAVTWLSNGGKRHRWNFFKVLCMKALSLYAFSNCKRGVCARNVRLLNFWSRPASSQELERVRGTCSPVPGVQLRVYEAGTDRDKGTEMAKSNSTPGCAPLSPLPD